MGKTVKKFLVFLAAVAAANVALRYADKAAGGALGRLGAI